MPCHGGRWRTHVCMEGIFFSQYYIYSYGLFQNICIMWPAKEKNNRVFNPFYKAITAVRTNVANLSDAALWKIKRARFARNRQKSVRSLRDSVKGPAESKRALSLPETLTSKIRWVSFLFVLWHLFNVFLELICLVECSQRAAQLANWAYPSNLVLRVPGHGWLPLICGCSKILTWSLSSSEMQKAANPPVLGMKLRDGYFWELEYKGVQSSLRALCCLNETEITKTTQLKG